LLLVSFFTFGQHLQSCQTASEKADRLTICGPARRTLSSQEPVVDSFHRPSCLCEMICDDLWFCFWPTREGISGLAVGLLAWVPEQCRITGLLQQCMLKAVNGIGRLTTAVYQPGCNELVKPIRKRGRRQTGDCADKFVSKLSPQDRADLSYLLRVRQSIQTRQQGGLQRTGHPQNMRHSGRVDRTFQNNFGQLLNE
jgi:hypothetical protein